MINREEAIGIPNLLVAPKEDANPRGMYEDGVGDYRASYGDGAYYAANSTSEIRDEQAAVDTNLEYFDSIMTKFETLRDQLQNHTPPPEALARLDDDHPTHVGALNTTNARWWRWKMRQVDPWPAQVASMDKSTVLRLLGLLSGGTLLKRGSQVDVGVGRWAWSLLARLPERGELTSEEIGVVRELGKKAVLVGMGLKGDAELDEGMDVVDPEEIVWDVDEEVVGEAGAAGAAALPTHGDIDNLDNSSAPQSSMPSTQTADTELSIDSDIPDLEKTPQDDTLELAAELAAAKARLLGNLTTGDAEQGTTEKSEGEPKLSKWNTRATVDMIITVAGEVYGQRDLLEFRAAWDQIV